MVAPLAGLCDPMEHGKQRIDPLTGEYLPASQVTHEVAEPLSCAWPVAHGAHAAVPSSRAWPIGQFTKESATATSAAVRVHLPGWIACVEAWSATPMMRSARVSQARDHETSSG